jgi:hypothetical protein
VKVKYVIMVLNHVKKTVLFNLIYNPDYHMVVKTIDVLSGRDTEMKRKFQNKKMSTLAIEF